MQLPVSLFIAFRYWKSKNNDRFGQLISRLGSIGITLGVMALIVVLSVMNGLEDLQKNQRLAGIPHLIVLPKAGYFSLTEQPAMQEKLSKISAQVEKSTPINQANVILQSAQAIEGAQMIGVQNFQAAPQLAEFVGDDFSSMLPPKGFKLMISANLAAKAHLNVGDKVRIMLSEHSQYTLLGQVPVQRIFTISEIYFDPNSAEQNVIFTNLADIGRLMQIKPKDVEGYRLFVKDPFQVEQVEQALGSEFRFIDWRAQKGEFFQSVKMEKNMMGLLVSLIIVVAISNILTSLSLMVVDKQGEIAILQSQGLTRAEIRSIFIGQGLLVGINGTVFGCLFGVLLTLNLNELLALIGLYGVFLPTLLNGVQIAIIVLGALFFTLLSTLYPAYAASKIDPARALRDE